MSQETREFIERLTLWLGIVGQHEILKTLPAYVTICKTPESLAKAILKRKKRQST